MKRTGTIAWLLAGVLFSTSAAAQQREDVFWARVMQESQEITLDGVLDEEAWEQAEVLELTFGEHAGLPGSGWMIENISDAIETPTDPPVGTVRMLAKGDVLYLAFEIQDESIGGNSTRTGFNWNWDAIIMPIMDKENFGPSDDGFHHFPSSREFMYTWWNNVDTTETGAPLPGVDPMHRSHHPLYGTNENFSVVDSARTEEQIENWNSATVVDGTANDDTHGLDNGYTVEMRLNMAPMGYDLTQNGGDVIGMGLAINDADGYWTGGAAEFATSRVGFQNLFGNFVSGAIRVHVDPAVTTAGEAPPDVEPDIIIPNGENFAEPVIDGVLDEGVWAELEPAVQLQYGNEDVIASHPGLTRYNSGYFRPGGPNETSPPAVEASLASIKWFFQDDWLYLGVDVDDQAIDSTRNEGGDGIRFTINDRTAVVENREFLQRREFIITIGPDGEPRLDGYFQTLDGEGAENAYQVDLSLKGASTVAEPNDVDEGYQIELALNLVEALGYPAGRGDGIIFLTAHTFDRDAFPDEANNYNVRAWWGRERADGVPPWGYMDPEAMVGTATEANELPESLRLLGNYPNPFNPSTLLRYELATAGEVRVNVYDLLGRRVATLAPGMQAAGTHQLEFNPTGLASGVYLYRIEVQQGNGQPHTAVGRMMLVK